MFDLLRTDRIGYFRALSDPSAYSLTNKYQGVTPLSFTAHNVPIRVEALLTGKLYHRQLTTFELRKLSSMNNLFNFDNFKVARDRIRYNLDVQINEQVKLLAARVASWPLIPGDDAGQLSHNRGEMATLHMYNIIPTSHMPAHHVLKSMVIPKFDFSIMNNHLVDEFTDRLKKGILSLVQNDEKQGIIKGEGLLQGRLKLLSGHSGIIPGVTSDIQGNAVGTILQTAMASYGLDFINDIESEFESRMSRRLKDEKYKVSMIPGTRVQKTEKSRPLTGVQNGVFFEYGVLKGSQPKVRAIYQGNVARAGLLKNKTTTILSGLKTLSEVCYNADKAFDNLFQFQSTNGQLLEGNRLNPAYLSFYDFSNFDTTIQNGIINKVVDIWSIVLGDKNAVTEFLSELNTDFVYGDVFSISSNQGKGTCLRSDADSLASGMVCTTILGITAALVIFLTACSIVEEKNPHLRGKQWFKIINYGDDIVFAVSDPVLFPQFEDAISHLKVKLSLEEGSLFLKRQILTDNHNATLLSSAIKGLADPERGTNIPDLYFFSTFARLTSLDKAQRDFLVSSPEFDKIVRLKALRDIPTQTTVSFTSVKFGSTVLEYGSSELCAKRIIKLAETSSDVANYLMTLNSKLSSGYDDNMTHINDLLGGETLFFKELKKTYLSKDTIYNSLDACLNYVDSPRKNVNSYNKMTDDKVSLSMLSQLISSLGLADVMNNGNI